MKPIVRKKKGSPAEKRGNGSALQRAKQRLASKKEANMPPGETFTEALVCAKTGKPYALLWHRENTKEFFTLREVMYDRWHDYRIQRKKPQKADSATATYRQSAFQSAYHDCPWCDAEGAPVRCTCGTACCEGGVYTDPDGTWHCNVVSCGCTLIMGSGKARSRICGTRSSRAHDTGKSRQPRLTHSSTRLLPKSK